jgi:5'-AMP-activated protein kinase, regulatory gamma subunit
MASIFEMTAGSFPFDRHVLTLESTTTVDKAFEALATNHVSSAPVFDSAKNEYIGFFDVNDMVAYVVQMLHHGSNPSNPLPESFRDLHHFLTTLTHYVPQEVSHIANLSANNPFCPVYEDTPFVQVS